ncbi:hypothetical protein [Stenotrophomonas rhizophila]
MGDLDIATSRMPSAAVRMVGNSVSPPPLRALAEANLDTTAMPMAVAA